VGSVLHSGLKATWEAAAMVQIALPTAVCLLLSPSADTPVQMLRNRCWSVHPREPVVLGEAVPPVKRGWGATQLLKALHTFYTSALQLRVHLFGVLPSRCFVLMSILSI